LELPNIAASPDEGTAADRSWRPAPRFADPAELSRTLTTRVLPLVQNPARYIGGELGTTAEGFNTTGANILLTFPDAYEVGMSHQGLRILYSLLQKRPDTYCDLAYAPWPDMEQAMRQEGLPLYALESRRAAGQFDVVGFSLGYELAYTNMINMIDLAGSPIWARDQFATIVQARLADERSRQFNGLRLIEQHPASFGTLCQHACKKAAAAAAYVDHFAKPAEVVLLEDRIPLPLRPTALRLDKRLAELRIMIAVLPKTPEFTVGEFEAVLAGLDYF
jgi:hypothetical protein